MIYILGAFGFLVIDSPLNTLYHAVQKVYAPLMLEDGKWSRSLDPKLQSLISELEAGLGAAMRKQDPSLMRTPPTK
jgi:dynein heavy chain 2